MCEHMLNNRSLWVSVQVQQMEMNAVPDHTFLRASNECNKLTTGHLKIVGPNSWNLCFLIRKKHLSLAGVAQWMECQPMSQTVAGLIPSQGFHCCGPGPQ